MTDRLSNPAFLRAREAIEGRLPPMTEQEQADFAAEQNAATEQIDGLQVADLFRRRQAAGECC